MSIPNICTNPDCTSRLHFIGGGYVYQQFLDNAIKKLDRDKIMRRRLKEQLVKNEEE